ncbi:HAMP domain-containing protein [Nodosilinea sp. LEGE 07088]|uniref:ATP-binding protein n=1 Tax=Nodosilinea sp. LEGE 07088 TaxID=2777968 RepID=UPI0018829F60|nr:ATP-binding protein [Nodosilinea sp. LEGE 07088]MBE9139890.1 HAMP domain-containing protein [Nodosilinea sp. LEGE 07088]
MKRPSLRLRLALWSAVLAGGALLGFALLSSWLIYQAKLDRLDARLVGPIPFGLPEQGSEIPVGPEVGLAQELGLTNASEVGVLMMNRTGKVVYQSPQWPLPSFSMPPVGDAPQRLTRQGARQIVTLRTRQGRWRVAVRSTSAGQMAIAASLNALHQEMITLRRIYGLIIPALLLAIGGGAWGLAGQALQPVRQLGQRMNQVTAQGLDQRLSPAGDPEFAPLIAAFNAMLERLERSFQQALRFSGDAAHELNTPLTILQGELEQAIHQVETGSPAQQTLSQLLDQVRQLSSIVRKLLLLSLADGGQMSIQRQPVDLSALVQDQLEDLALLAPDLTLKAEIEPGLMVSGDRDLLYQVIQNLITNAAKYNLPQGWVGVTIHRQSPQVVLTVVNATPPLTAAEASRLFDRFYRGESARAAQTEGLGLGLSLARELARAHGGDLVFVPGAPDAAQFDLHLPAHRASTTIKS